VNRFEGPPIDGEEYAQAYYDDVGVKIREVGGDRGVEYLLARAGTADAAHLRATFLALTMPPPIDRSDVRSLLESHLSDKDGGVVAYVIDGLAALGNEERRASVSNLSQDSRPLVRAAVLRYEAQVRGKEAVPQLIQALSDSDPIVREEAVDQLDELDVMEALPNVLELAADPHPHVREAVETFKRNRQFD
jgi:HEAT repeats